MIESDATERAGYWLQLSLAVGIATMGLVLDSGAVVIAAMLVAPLMSPIERLGMGLAIGSPFLVLQSTIRVLISVLVAVAASASIVRALPFQAMTDEIAARTLPTALDLTTAAFCALAGAYAAVRPSSDVASTAAGTSIGISLVPPLCVCGYGLGAIDLPTASGAALLFVTNLVAIVVVATATFAILGFNRVDVEALEHDALARASSVSRIAALARHTSRRFSAIGSIVLRLAMPLALLAAVYVPLRAALDEVAWEIRVRNHVAAAVARLGEAVLDSSIAIDRHTVAVGVVLIGSVNDAEELREALAADIGEVSGTAPRVTVAAVPDAREFAGLAEALRKVPPSLPTAPPIVPPPPPPPPSVAERVDTGLVLIDDAVRQHWPEVALGALLAIRVESTDDGLVVSLVHHGEPLDAATSELLGRDLSRTLEHDVHVEDLDIPTATREAEPTVLASDLARWLDRSRAVPAMWLCVGAPPLPALPRRGRPRPADPARDILTAMIYTHPRVVWTDAARWSIRFARGDCRAEPAAPGGG